jgi:butyrate kinase
MRIVVINPGSTSTKLGVFQGTTPAALETLRHDSATLRAFASLMDQAPWRESLVRQWLMDQGVALEGVDAFMARGGLMAPVPSGVLAVDDAMLEDLRSCRFGAHASNLGAIIARRLAPEGVPVLTADPVVVDEMDSVARFSGHPDIVRRSIFHALNHKAVARRAAATLGKSPDALRLVVAHLGGGISVAAHRHGRVVDVNNALDGDGPFSPERSGGLPVAGVLAWCAEGLPVETIRRKIVGGGGLAAYLGTNNAQEAASRMEAGDTQAAQVLEAMAYQVAKEIGAMAVVLQGRVDAIVLTGGLAACAPVVEGIRRQVAFLAPVMIFPGEDEMGALAEAAEAALAGEKPIMRYAAVRLDRPGACSPNNPRADGCQNPAPDA